MRSLGAGAGMERELSLELLFDDRQDDRQPDAFRLLQGESHGQADAVILERHPDTIVGDARLDADALVRLLLRRGVFEAVADQLIYDERDEGGLFIGDIDVVQVKGDQIVPGPELR